MPIARLTTERVHLQMSLMQVFDIYFRGSKKEKKQATTLDGCKCQIQTNRIVLVMK